MLQRKAKTVKDLKKLKCLEAETEDPKGSCSKRPCHEDLDANPFSSNNQAVAFNSAIDVSSSNTSDSADKANLLVNLFCLSF